MSTETRTDAGVASNRTILHGAAAGLVGSGVMAAVMFAMGATPVLAGAIPGLYTIAPPATPAAGVGLHLFHGVVLGVVFAGVVTATDVESPMSTVGAGVAYGVVTWVLLAALLMPVWLSAVGFPKAPPFPNFAVPSLLWHVVYGVVTGAVFTAVRD